VGDVHEVTELITPGPAQALAGLLGAREPGAELPLLWHWGCSGNPRSFVSFGRQGNQN